MASGVQPKDPAEARRVLKRALELGVNFIDTADAYGPNVDEDLIAAALYPYPRGLVIATKGGLTRPSAGQWVPDGRPEHLRAACEGSLKRLKLERIDLYQFHTIDPKVPLEDSIGELARLQKEGKIRHVGVSNFKVDELARAQRIVPIVSVQNRYNASDRSSQAVLDACTRQKLAFIPWAPVASGSAARLEKENEGKGLEAVAQARGISVFQVAIAWLLAQSPAMLPIPGHLLGRTPAAERGSRGAAAVAGGARRHRLRAHEADAPLAAHPPRAVAAISPAASWRGPVLPAAGCVPRAPPGQPPRADTPCWPPARPDRGYRRLRKPCGRRG